MAKFDLETKISKFDSIKSTLDPSETTVSEALAMIKEGDYAEDISLLRELGSGDDYDLIKQEGLPAISFHAYFSGRRSKANVQRLNGIIVVDVDDVDIELIPEFKKEIIYKMDSVLAAMTSPSGDGIKCLYLVDDMSLTPENYRIYGKEVAKKFSKYGKTDVLSLTDCLIMTFDADIEINEDATFDTFIKIDESKSKSKSLPKRDDSKVLFDTAQDLFEKVLEQQIKERANNNYHFIQMSVLELAKYDMVEDQDLSFLLASAPSQSSKNETRLEEAIFASSGVEQTHWAYDFSENIDRSIGVSVERKKNKEGIPVELVEATENDHAELNIIEYDGMYDKVLSTMKLGDRVGAEISLSNFADIFRWDVGLTVVTGIPSHGKTEWLDQNIIDLARLYKWKTGVAGFEQSEEEHLLKMMRKVSGFDIRKDGAEQGEVRSCYDFVVDHIKHVDVGKTGGDIDEILEAFENLYYLYGIKNFVIDPFNLLSVNIKATGHEKSEEIIRKMVLFCKRLKVGIILIAHPTKMRKREGSDFYEVPDLYSVKGTSAFYEMAYHGMVVYRNEKGQSEGYSVMVRILKVKQNNLGRRGGEAYFDYNLGSGRYKPVDSDGIPYEGDWAEKNWHLKVK